MNSSLCCDFSVMDKLEGPAKLMVVSDLDFTMVDHDDPQDVALLSFDALWEACYRHDSLLVFSTGRSPTIYSELRRRKPLLTPDVAIMSVGTEIMYGEAMIPDREWERHLDHKWDRDIVARETSMFPELILQSETEQRPYKLSFFVDKDKALQVIQSLSMRLQKHGLEFKIIHSNGTALDVLPKGAGKGQALAYLLGKFKAEGKLPLNILVCGDSGNDAELFTVPQVHGVMVANAQEELLRWYVDKAKNNPKITHSTERCAAGIIQAMGYFNLGPNVSPRNIRDVTKCTLQVLGPAHEVVKFYVLYERWRRAEIEKSDQLLQYMKRIFCPTGVYVHPSGIEHLMSMCMDTIARFHGDKQTKRYYIWLDHVSSAQIGPDSWLVKFDRWESNGSHQVTIAGEERQCSITTILLTKQEDVFMWLHVHQTWLDGFGPTDQSSWLL